MNRVLATRVVTAIVLGCLAIPASAQNGALGTMISQPYQRLSKSDAILGGASSKLAAILNQQTVPSPSAMPVAAAFSTSPAARYAQYESRRAVPVDRPDVFGSVALRVPTTPLDDRWGQIMRRPIGTTAEAFVEGIAGVDKLARIDAVNRYVNTKVAFNSDSRMFGVEDRWSAAAETLRRAQGDCEDFAIAKMQMLRHAGFDDADLYLVVLRDTRRELDHAVLVVRADGRFLVLDNGTSRIMDSDVMPEYRPILTYSGGKAWTHGYRRTAPTVTYAALDQTVVAPPRLDTLEKVSALDLPEPDPDAPVVATPTDLGAFASVAVGLSLGGLALPF
jgi:predicted transglutaminase-like cysteine proteinase